MQDNALTHSARGTKGISGFPRIQKQHVVGVASEFGFPNLNSIENLLTIMKRGLYADGKQF